MTERDITGDAVSQYRRAQRIAKDHDLTDADLRAIADGVREFDAQRSPEQRTLVALEQIAKHLVPEREGTNSWNYEARRLRRREVYAQELMAVAIALSDLGDISGLNALRGSAAFSRLFDRLTSSTLGALADAPA